MADNIFTKTNGSFERKLPYYLAAPGTPTENIDPRTFPNANPEGTMTMLPQYYNQGPTIQSNALMPTNTTRSFNELMTRIPEGTTPTSGVTQQPVQPTQTTQTQQTYTPTPVSPTVGATKTTTTQNPYDAFNLLLQDALKQAQGIDTTELLKQQRVLQREALARRQGTGIQTATPEELRFLSPTQQASMRGANVGALSADLDEIAYQITRANQDRANLIEQIQMARQSGNEAQAREWEAQDRELQRKLTNLQIQKTQAELAGELIGSQGWSYSAERAARTINSVDELLSQVSGKTVGFGSWLKGIPTSAANYFQGQLNTLKSNIAFNELTQMREASKTGGALGQVSDREGKLLESALGALGQDLSQEQITTQLNKVKNSINNWQRAVDDPIFAEQLAREYGWTGETRSSGNYITAPDGTLIEIID